MESLWPARRRRRRALCVGAVRRQTGTCLRAVSRRISRRYLGGVSQARADSLAVANTKLSEAIAAEDAEMGRMKSELKTSLMWTRARAKSMAEKAKLMLGARS